MRGTTTTHDCHGGGRPRLFFAAGGRVSTHEPQREFPLLPGVTTIGSGADADLCLAGLAPLHARIERDDTDNYSYFHCAGPLGSTVHGRPARHRNQFLLITGARIEFGLWTLVYLRDEFADHGRPHGGRQGGEFAFQRPQYEPSRRGATVAGGRSATDDDPGEYY